MAFELRKMYRFQVPAGVITPGGIQDITRFITSQNTQAGEWKTLNPELTTSLLPTLPEDWTWEWLVSGRGEYVGTFPKRVSKYFFKTYGLKCPQSFIMQIGNLAKQHSEGQEVYIFDFVDRIGWEAGDYGDYGSCWWTDYAGAKQMLEDNGGMAIRFFDSNEQGMGRAWLVEIDDDLYILFNGYGFDHNSTLKITRVFSLFVGLQYKQIHLSNRYGGMFINNDSGYVVGRMERIDEIESHDFDWYAVYVDTCSNCGRVLYEGDVQFGADDAAYCEYCYGEFFGYCEHCGEDYAREDLTYVESVNSDVCERCLDRKFDLCPRCDEYYKNRRMERFGEALICPECSEELKILGDNIE